MSWFWNDRILVAIALLVAAIGGPLGYFGIISFELMIITILPLFVTVAVLIMFAMLFGFRSVLDLVNHLSRNWPDWARWLVGIDGWRDRPRGNDDAPN